MKLNNVLTANGLANTSVVSICVSIACATYALMGAAVAEQGKPGAFDFLGIPAAAFLVLAFATQWLSIRRARRDSLDKRQHLMSE